MLVPIHDPARHTAARRLSRVMLLLGGGLFLLGLALGLPSLRAVLAPAGDAGTGAVVLAATASPTARPSLQPSPSSLPVTPSPQPSPGSSPAVPAVPTPLPTPAPTPTPTPRPTPADPPSRIVAPAIDLDAEVIPMGWHKVDHKGKTWSEWLVPEDAAGWLITSAPPGQPGNTVLSGHHNIHARVFRYVVDLEPGDAITVYAGAQAFRYIVVEKYILKEAGMPLSVRHENAQWIVPTDDERLTLVTCWPYEWPGNTHRVIVVARPG